MWFFECLVYRIAQSSTSITVAPDGIYGPTLLFFEVSSNASVPPVSYEESGSSSGVINSFSTLSTTAFVSTWSVIFYRIRFFFCTSENINGSTVSIFTIVSVLESLSWIVGLVDNDRDSELERRVFAGIALGGGTPYPYFMSCGWHLISAIHAVSHMEASMDNEGSGVKFVRACGAVHKVQGADLCLLYRAVSYIPHGAWRCMGEQTRKFLPGFRYS